MPRYNHDSGKWECEYCDEYKEIDKRKVNMHEISVHREERNQEAEPEEDPLLEIEPKLEELHVQDHEKPKKRKRIPFGVPQQKLPNVPDNDGFHYRIVNDNWQKDPFRIQRAQQGGYEKVKGYEPVTVGTNDDGTSIKGILMRIPREWYEEDQKEKQRSLDAIDEAIGKGTFEQQVSDKRYVPQGIKIHANYNENG